MSNGCCVYCTSGLCMANAALVYISRHRIMAGNGGGGPGGIRGWIPHYKQRLLCLGHFGSIYG